jgi:FixJ family two-component response regulator
MDNSLATVFIVDDDMDLCRALGRLLRSTGYSTRVFHSSVEFLAAYDPEPLGCIILDISMPEFDGLEVQAMLHSSGCIHPIIFLTGNGSVQCTVAAFRAGAVNFLTKPVHDNELFSAVGEALRINTAHRNQARICRTVTDRLGTLTPRERQVLEQVVRGRLNKQIAADLGTVEKTIKVHRGRVMQKMGARSLADLVHLAGSAGIGVDRSERAVTLVEPFASDQWLSARRPLGR